jgi:hypothetical protein
MLLHEIGPQSVRDPAAAMEIVDKPGSVQPKTTFALLAPDCPGIAWAKDVLAAGG